MPNQLLTTDKIVTRALAVLHEVLTVPPNVNRQYSDEFAGTGAKSGDSIRIRKPARFVANDGAAVNSFQDVNEDYATLTIAKQFNVPVQFSSKELTLSMDDFESIVLRPAMAALASKIDQYAFEVLNTGCGAVVLGTGTSGAIKWSDLVKAGAYLDQNATPRDGNRSVLINPLTQVNVLDETKGLFNAPGSIAEQYREGVIGRTGGFLFTSASRAPVINLPEDLEGTVSGSYTQGASTINLAGLAKGKEYPAGSAFTVTNVYDVHPETKQSLGRLHAFVVRAKFNTDSDGKANNVSIFPVYATTEKQNVTALPSSGAAVTFVGTANTSYRQTFAFHRDAFAFATVDMVLPTGASRKVMDGISMRYASDWDGKEDKHIKRFDVLCGIAPIYPEMCVKLLEPNT